MTDSSLMLPTIEDVMEFVPVRIFWKDLNLRYLGCNQKFAEDAGLSSPKEIIGKSDFELGWSDNATLYRNDDTQVIETGESKNSYQEPQTRKGGDTRWLLTSKQPLKANGEIVGVLGTYDDITKHHANHIALERNNRMEVVGRMASSIAHDFNNVLMPISMYGELLGQKVSHDKSLQESRDGFCKALQHAGDLCNQLVSFAKDEIRTPTNICPNETIKTLMPLLDRLGDNRVKIKYRLGRMAGPILMDPTRLERVIVNLVTNAKQAIPDSGTILILTESIQRPIQEMASKQASEHFLMTIADSGPGISKQVQSKIFDRFVSTKIGPSYSSGNQGSSGAGLGLAICNEIITNAGGVIHVKSKPGHGTEFQVSIPFGMPLDY